MILSVVNHLASFPSPHRKTCRNLGRDPLSNSLTELNGLLLGKNPFIKKILIIVVMTKSNTWESAFCINTNPGCWLSSAFSHLNNINNIGGCNWWLSFVLIVSHVLLLILIIPWKNYSFKKQYNYVINKNKPFKIWKCIMRWSRDNIYMLIRQ